MSGNAGAESARMFQLFGAAVDGTIDAEQTAALEALLMASPEARRLWFLHADMDIALSEWAAEHNEAGLSAPTKVVPMKSVSTATATTRSATYFRSPNARFFQWAAILVVGCALGLLGIAGYVFFPSGVAVITRENAARWKDDAPARNVPLPSRSLTLSSGAVEIKMASGATVVFEGPGELDLLTGNSVRLCSGRARANVPQSAKGFTMTGAAFCVVDYGTEFGCEVLPGANGPQIHVMNGLVEVKPSLGKPRMLRANQAVEIQDYKTMKPLDVRPESFMDSGDLARAESAPSALSGVADRILQKHPSKIFYFRAGNPPGDPASEVPGMVRHGCLTVEGRFPSSKAVKMQSREDFFTVSLPGSYSSLTLLAWIKGEKSSRRQDLLAGSGAFVKGEIAWYLYGNRALGFGTLDPVAGTPERGWQILHGLPNQDFQSEWCLVATVVDGQKQTVTHYLNGKVVGMGQLDLPGLLRPGSLQIGGVSETRINGSPRQPFSGCLDEFAILSSPLRADEIGRLYELGRAPREIASNPEPQASQIR